MILRPTPAFAYSHPAHVIALGLGAGLARFAPGTFGTLAAWPAGWALNGAHPALVFPVIAAAFLLGVWACGVTAHHLGIQDHGSMVWDEIVAFLLVAAVLPRELGWQLAGFVAFRAFDIVKPAPIRWIERRFHGGFGVMLDDLVAAGYALLVLALARRLLFHG
jgi:phosphatidylglycerophosphatase A